jgi:hypothetical protein
VNIEKLTPESWSQIAEDAHLICYNEIRPNSMNTIDYALVVYDAEKIKMYATIIEMEKGVAHMQHGGALPGTKGTAVSFRAYKCIIMHLAKEYDATVCNVENTNTPMLQIALKMGFIPVGMDCHMQGYYEGTYLHMFRDNSKEREECYHS